MAGGNWLSTNKVRPGAYLNFQSVPRPMITVGDRGIATIGLPLSWGKQGELIDVYSDELLNGKSRAKVGFTAFDTESKMLNAMLSNCYLAKVFRMDTGGVKAEGKIGNLEMFAKYTGVFGNKITVSVVKINPTLFDVSTFIKGALVDSQKVTEIAELENNDYVTFGGTGAITENAGMPFTKGKDGVVAETTAYPEYLKLLQIARWQVLAIPSVDDSIKSNIVTFIENQRNGEGKYVQAVLSRYSGADFEGIINNYNGCIIDEVTFSPEEFTAIVAGATAGASIITSNTGKVIMGASQIIDELDNSGIIAALKEGKFVLSPNQSGNIKVEQDINSLHTLIPSKNYAFSKNRVLRTLDEIGTSIRDIWERSYMGKVNNDANGRAIFRADIISYLSTLQSLGAVQEFSGAKDVEVLQGADLDAVICNIWVKPVDSMEKLYMTCNIIG